MAYVLKEHGPQLHLVLAWDEATPGNVLQPDLQRKAAMTYGAIAQMPVLWADDAWMTLACHSDSRNAELRKWLSTVACSLFTVAEAASPAWLHARSE